MKKEKSNGQKKFKKTLYKKLISYFDKHVNEEITINDLGEFCHVSRHNFSILKQVLNLLINEHYITRRRGGLYVREAKENLIVGTLRVSDKGAGFVQIDDSDEEIFIRSSDKNMAFNKDKVVVEVLATTKGKLREGRIISVEKRAYNQFPGIYHQTRYYSYTAPIDRRMTKEFLIPADDNMDAVDGQVVVFELKEWPENELNPVGKIVKILGSQDDPNIDIETLIVSYGVGDDFSPEVIAEAEQKQLALTEDVLDNRLDLRELATFTIDPDDAKDFDDAVSLQELENGNWYLGVHIADVSHFVEEKSELDLSAHERGCSVYLVDRVIPMLPEFLSNELCSLKANVDRLTYSCFMEIDKAGDLISYELKPSIINSKRRYSYEEVQRILDDPDSSDEFAEMLRKMWDLARFLGKKRIEAGAMDFDTPEVKFVLDENGFPIDILPRIRLNSMRLIEEFMLMANKTVALHIEWLSEKRIRLPFIYRVHEKPSTIKIDRFVEFMRALGYNIRGDNLNNVKNFQTVLQSVHGTPEINLIEEIALRSMMKAMYTTENIGHYGLGFDHYTHFTSPIRRYPDLWVHRLLKEYEHMVGKVRISALKNIIKSAANQSNAREINAQQAERDSIKLKQIEYISQYIGEEFEGLVSGVMEFGLFIELNDTLIEGLVHIRDLEDDYYEYDEKGMSLNGRHNKHRYRLGDPIRIKVAAVNKENRNIDFILVYSEERKIIKNKKSSAAKTDKKKQKSSAKKSAPKKKYESAKLKKAKNKHYPKKKSRS